MGCIEHLWGQALVCVGCVEVLAGSGSQTRTYTGHPADDLSLRVYTHKSAHDLDSDFTLRPATSSANLSVSSRPAVALPEWRDENQYSKRASNRKTAQGLAHKPSAEAEPGRTPSSVFAEEGAKAKSSSSSTADNVQLVSQDQKHVSGAAGSQKFGPSAASPALLTSSIVRSAQEGVVDTINGGWSRLRAIGPRGVTGVRQARREVGERQEVGELPSLIRSESGAYLKVAGLGSPDPIRSMMPRRPSPLTAPSAVISPPSLVHSAASPRSSDSFNSASFAASLPNLQLGWTRTRRRSSGDGWVDGEILEDKTHIGMA